MIGQTISHYQVTGKLGAGGMGEVYRARDSKLNREVAIKVLPESFAEDAERVARFQREAQVLASLNHPNIAAIYGLEESDGIHALVMELVEGPTLADRITAGPIPVDEALAIAKQIAEALEVAHERGIIHRDLKPANVKVTPDDTVKVLDFGLAKISSNDTPSDDLSHSPTMIKGTQAGMILGTAAYMSPEQAKGKAVDKRADIWAFGCVLFEMLAGKQSFSGETLTDTLAAVVRAEPDWDALPASTPSLVHRLLHRCLTKDLKQRLRDIGEARIQIEEHFADPAKASTSKSSPGARPAVRAWMLWVSVALAIALVVSLALLWRTPKADTRPIARYDIQAPNKTILSLSRWPTMALSPDGSTLAFVAFADGVSRLYIRKRDDPELRPLAGTEGAVDPAFSPNGNSLAFVGDFTLKKVSFDGPVVSLIKVSDSRGVTWVDDDTLVYAPESAAGLFQISSNGGAPRPVTTVDNKKNERTHRWPQALPGGKAVLFTVGVFDKPDDYDGADIEAVDLATGERRLILQSASMVRYVPTGHLIFAREGILYAVGFDPGNLLKQDAQTTPVVDTQFIEYGAALSADGRWLAYQSNESGRPEVYVRDMAGSGGRWSISTGGGEEPRWSPDGRELYYRNKDLFVSVTVDTRSGFQAGTPKTLFNGVLNLRSNSGISYDVDPKGNRFLMLRQKEEDSSAAQLRIVLNWFEELRRLAPLN